MHSHDAAFHAEGAREARTVSVLVATHGALRERRRRLQNIVGVVEVKRDETRPESLKSWLRLHRLQRAKLNLHACNLCEVRVPNVGCLLLIRSQRAARCKGCSLRFDHRPDSLEHSGCQNTLMEVNQALFIVDVVDQERASNKRNHFGARTAPGKARQVRLRRSTEV